MECKISSDTLDKTINAIVNNLANDDINSSKESSLIIEEMVFKLPFLQNYSISQKSKIADIIFHRIFEYDVLQPYLEDEQVTEIMCNGYQDIFVERNGVLEQTDTKFYKNEHFSSLINKIVSEVNRKIDFSSPIVDARLKDGSRVNIVLNPVALNGPILTIRKFSKKVYSLDMLTQMGSISQTQCEFLKTAICEHKNIFISGGTGSGKTTLLNALCQEIESNERIITIEDSAEITIKGLKNVVSLEKREANMEGLGEISIAELIKTALRMRPDRIIVGEIRGKEAIDMLQAMNTGHSGSISTGHANTPYDMLKRIETMVLSGMEIPMEAIRQQIASAIDIVVHVRRENGIRKIDQIMIINGYSNSEYEVSILS